MTKLVVMVPDGCADAPIAALGDRTPLEAAAMPNLARLAAGGVVGRAEVIPAGLPPGSDVGNMAILGYDPVAHHTGRAPIEAAAMGVELAPDEVAFRCNLVELSPDGIMVDFAAGHLASAQSRPIVEALDRELGDGRDGVRFTAGVEYRHLVVVPSRLGGAVCVPPHDLSGRPAILPEGPGAAELRDLMERSRDVVGRTAREVGATATQIWLWGQGTRPSLPSFQDRYGVGGALTSAVDLVRGLGVLAGLDVLDVPTATAGFDNDYAAQRDAALAALETRDLCLVHVEATDEAGHQGLPEVKVDALERWDREIIGPIADVLGARGAFRVLLLPDHATPCELRTHTADTVPYLLFDSEVPGAGGVYSEAASASCDPVPAHGLMSRLVSGTR